MGELEPLVAELRDALKPFAMAYAEGKPDAAEMRAWVGSAHFERAFEALARADAALNSGG